MQNALVTEDDTQAHRYLPPTLVEFLVEEAEESLQLASRSHRSRYEGKRKRRFDSDIIANIDHYMDLACKVGPLSYNADLRLKCVNAFYEGGTISNPCQAESTKGLDHDDKDRDRDPAEEDDDHPPPQRSPIGLAPLHAACQFHSIAVISHLLSLGADPYSQTADGLYPLELFFLHRMAYDGGEQSVADAITLIHTFVKYHRFDLSLISDDREPSLDQSPRNATFVFDQPEVREELYRAGMQATQSGLIAFLERTYRARLCGCQSSRQELTPRSRSFNEMLEDIDDTALHHWDLDAEEDSDDEPTEEQEETEIEIENVFQAALYSHSESQKKKDKKSGQEGEAREGSQPLFDILFYRLCDFYPWHAEMFLVNGAVDTNYIPHDSHMSSLALFLAPTRGHKLCTLDARRAIRKFAECGFRFDLMDASSTPRPRRGEDTSPVTCLLFCPFRISSLPIAAASSKATPSRNVLRRVSPSSVDPALLYIAAKYHDAEVLFDMLSWSIGELGQSQGRAGPHPHEFVTDQPEWYSLEAQRLVDAARRGEGLAKAPFHIPLLQFLFNPKHMRRETDLLRGVREARQEKSMFLIFYEKLADEISEMKANGQFVEPEEGSTLHTFLTTSDRNESNFLESIKRVRRYLKMLQTILWIFIASGADFLFDGYRKENFLWKVKLVVRFENDETTATCPQALAKRREGTLMALNGTYTAPTLYGLKGVVPLLIGFGEFSYRTIDRVEMILRTGVNVSSGPHDFSIEEALRFILERRVSCRDDSHSAEEEEDEEDASHKMDTYEELLNLFFDFGVITPDDLFGYLMDFAELYYSDYLLLQESAGPGDRRGAISAGASEDDSAAVDADANTISEDDADLHLHATSVVKRSSPSGLMTHPLPRHVTLYYYREVLNYLLSVMGDCGVEESRRARLAQWDDDPRFHLDFRESIEELGHQYPCYHDERRFFSRVTLFVGDEQALELRDAGVRRSSVEEAEYFS